MLHLSSKALKSLLLPQISEYGFTVSKTSESSAVVARATLHSLHVLQELIAIEITKAKRIKKTFNFMVQ
jgi:hypothetical protein